MKVGDYARTCYGTIFKIENITEIDVDGEYFKSKVKKNSVIKDLPNFMYAEGEILNKTSPNIIDLIELGDLVRLFMEDDVDKEDTNIFEVVAIPNDKKTIGVFTGNFEIEFFPIENLRGIVTREQFSQMEYRIGE